MDIKFFITYGVGIDVDIKKILPVELILMQLLKMALPTERIVKGY